MKKEKEQETEQFNIRLSNSLITDLNFIASLLKLSKSDWIRTQLARDVYEEKHRLLLKLSTLHGHKSITKEELEELTGSKIADQIERKNSSFRELPSKPTSYIH